MKKVFTSLAIAAALAIATSFAAFASAPPDDMLASMNAPVEQMAVVDVQVQIGQADVALRTIAPAPIVMASLDGHRTVDLVQSSARLQHVGEVRVIDASPPTPPLRI